MKIFTLPNALTCLNLFCGCAGIVAVFHNDLLLASVLIGVAGIADFSDGFVARLLNSSSEIGKELDSLADVVTFGVLPSIIIFYYLQIAVPTIDSLWATYLAFLMAIFSALRLAKFNVDTRQNDSFIGVPTPANALVVASVPFILRQHPNWQSAIVNVPVLLGYVGIMSFLLIAELPLFALKFKSFGWRGNQVKYVFLGASVVLLLGLGFTALPFIVLLYIILSIFTRFFL